MSFNPGWPSDFDYDQALVRLQHHEIDAQKRQLSKAASSVKRAFNVVEVIGRKEAASKLLIAALTVETLSIIL